MISREQARRAFDEYVSAYDPTNPRIALKIDHTLRVAELCDRIASSEGLDSDVAWLCGLLHDVGRFEQVRRFNTFNDAVSVSHAALGADVLFGDADPRGPQIRAYVDEDDAPCVRPQRAVATRDDDKPLTRLDDLLRTAIATHSAYRIPEELDPQTRAYCHVLRDADKIDIIKVNCICPIEDIYGVSERDMFESKLSPAVVEGFYEHRTLPRNIREYPADVLVGHICFAWELVYSESRRILAEQGYLERMLSRHFARPDTQHTFERMAEHMRAWLR